MLAANFFLFYRQRRNISRKRKSESAAPESMGRDLYRTLSLSHDASQSDIKKAYRKKALKYHPDKVAGGNP